MPSEHQVIQKISALISVFLQINIEQICKMLPHIEFLDKIMLVNISNGHNLPQKGVGKYN